jgi:hypothetical protein
MPNRLQTRRNTSIRVRVKDSAQNGFCVFTSDNDRAQPFKDSRVAAAAAYIKNGLVVRDMADNVVESVPIVNTFYQEKIFTI